MQREPSGNDSPQSSDEPLDKFAVREAEVLVGQGAMTGRGLGSAAGSRRELLESQLRDVVCAECGVVARDVPAIAIEGFRRQHEADSHPDIYLQRKKLELAILALNRRLWSR
jgi:hypothetical protein